MGRGRVPAAVQAAGQQQLSMASERNRSAAVDRAGSPLAAGRTGH